jgi:tetraacyldisaccharide 4'-kinase
MSDPRFFERIWYGSDALASATRTVLIPAERVFGGVVGARDLLYDAGWLPARETGVPAVSVGNLTVGGTGKTPIAVWIARGLEARGAHPAIVLRGYGDDEPLVHQTLNPLVPVIVNADRVAGVAEAVRRGADIVVLDDAFQHRRVQRSADLVLVSADQWTPVVRLLPAGPWREPLRAVRRATLIIVTRKAASDDVVASVHERLAAVAPGVPRLSVRLDPGELVRVGDERETKPLDALRGRTARSILSIGDPSSFIRQMEARGIRVIASIFPDHHAFNAAEVERIARGFVPDDSVVCTLKDAVKLAPHWPRLAPPLWYVSQQVMVERGVGGLERVLDDLVGSRSSNSPTAG